jgi:hypothetical protein
MGYSKENELAPEDLTEPKKRDFLPEPDRACFIGFLLDNNCCPVRKQFGHITNI